MLRIMIYGEYKATPKMDDPYHESLDKVTTVY